MDKLEYDTKIWSFYCKLEKDFLNTLNYISFSEDNYSTYSIEYERLILSICSEIDILFKLICKYIDPEQSPKNINSYYSIVNRYYGLLDSEILCELTKQSLCPFSEWTEEHSPEWWKAYNKIKHDRISDDNYKLGNLKNVYHSLAGLYVLNRHYCKMISASIDDAPRTQSHLFSMVGWDICIPQGNGFYQVLPANGGMRLVYKK